ncbi:hypothetical protein ACNKHM_09955 [Shigella sonnei]
MGVVLEENRQRECPVIDTWWQTETGGAMITPLAGAIELKADSPARPFFGVQPALVDNEGHPQGGATEGSLVITDSVAGCGAYAVWRSRTF